VVRIEYSPIAILDIEQIGDYIEQEYTNPKAALDTVNKIQDKIDNLSDFPLIGATLSSIADIETDYRFLVCGNYLIFYRVEEKVYIDRVLHGKRDYLAILFPDVQQDTNHIT